MTAIRVLTGPFHPDLEESLRAHLEAWSRPGEKGRPLPAFALVAPSQEMRRHLKRLITLRWGMTLAGAHLLTAYHLSRRIVRASDGPPPPADDLILEGLIRELVLAGDFPAEWKGIVRTAGGAGALHRTLRDLEEARVPAAGGRGDPILRLHARYQKARRERGFGTHTDPVEAAIGLSAESAFLRSLDHVAYYGFYDMTQVQLDLLERVSSVSPTTFFLPCVPGHRAYGFAEDFLEVLRGRFPEADVRPATDGEGQERKGGAPPGGPSPVLRSALDRIFRDEPGDRGAAAAAAAAEAAAKLESFTASGPEAELEIAAKRILRWTEEEGFRFDEMGVVARRLSPYLPFLAAVFDAHAVPFRTPEAQPVSRLPWAKALSTLNRVLAEDFPRTDVLELLTSPFFRTDAGGASVGEAARRLARRMAVRRGVREWEKVVRLPAEELAERGVEEGAAPLPVDEVRVFQDRLGVLIGAAKAFPNRGPWRAMAGAYRVLTEAVLDLSRVPEREAEGPAGAGGGGVPSDHLEDILEALGARERLTKETDAASFLSALGDHLRARTVPVRDPGHAAVEVLNAMDARGKGFACLVVMGLQEGDWPWRGSEDPFLSDAARGRLAEAHGVRLLKKSAGHDEERLLFTLALASGRERVVLTRQRSGEEGKPLVRSWYVHELARALGHREGELPGALHVPRSLAERFRGGITSEAFWTPSEWTARLLLQDRNPEALHAVRGLAPGVLAGCFEAGVQLKGLRGELTGRDGMTGGLPDLWKEFRKRGWSPTALEEYARCPFRFFADRVLGLEELEGLEEVAETEARDTGSLLHAILQRFFSRWSEGASADASRLLSEVVDSALDAFQEENPVGYPLLWERTREEIRSLAEGYVEGELRSLEESGYRPVAFEEDAEAALPDVPGAPSILRGMKIRGRLDRIDRREDGGEARLRVVDYKYRSGTTPPSPNLAQSALRARTLQPAFYVLLAEARERGAKAGAELHYLAPRWPEGDDRRRAFPPEAWETAWAAEMLDTVERLLKGIRAGSFYIIPDGDEFGYCAHCPYRPLCRKNHRPTRYRQKADPRTHAVEKLREKKWSPKS